MTTSDYLNQLISDKTALVNNLTSKGISGLTGDETFTELVPQVLNIPSGTPEPQDVIEKDVNFYDYDGTRVYSYTKEEFLLLESLPANPTHTGLTSQGWNWTYQNAKAYVTNNGILDVGQMYITNDGSTKIYLTLTRDTLTPYLKLTNISGTITVDWGDSSATEEMNTSIKTLSHTYSTIGEYMIKLTPDDDVTFKFADLISDGTSNVSTRKYDACVKNIEIGKGVLSLNVDALSYSMIEKINLPSNITELNSDCLSYCYNLKGIVIPNSITAMSSYNQTGYFRSDYCLFRCVLPDSITSFTGTTYANRVWDACKNLQSLIVPIQLTTLPNGFFSSTGVIKAVIPTNITQMSDSYYAGMFQDCNLLEEVSIAPTLTKIGWRTFLNCYSLKHFIIPNTVTEIQEYAFSGCQLLEEINLPEGLTTIGQYAFTSCKKITEFIFPSTIASIGQYAFSNADNNRVLYDFSASLSIPTLANSNAFSGAGTYKIVVPDTLYTDWIATNQWSNLSTHIISKTDYDNL